MNLTLFLLSSLAISSDTQLPLAQKLIEIHQFNYNTSKTTLVIANSSSESLAIDKFLSGGKNVPFAATIVDWRYRVPKKSKNLRWLPECHTDAVAFCEDLHECLEFIVNLFQEFTINPRSLFTIVLENYLFKSRTELETFLKAFFEECWSRNMAQIVVLFQNQVTDEILAFSYHPYQDEFLQDLSKKPSETYFPKNKFRNLNGKPFRMSLFNLEPNAINLSRSDKIDDQNWRGTDGRLLREIPDYLNASITLISPSGTEKFGFEEFYNQTCGIIKGGAAADVASRRVDIALNTRSLIPSFFVESLYPFLQDPVMVIVPKAQTIPMSLNFLRTFDHESKILIFISYCLTLSINALFRMMGWRSGGTKFRAFSSSFVETTSVLFWTSTHSPPHRQAHRLSFIAWSMFSFLILNAFSSRLTSIFIAPFYEDDINTLRQLTVSKYRVGILEKRVSLMELYRNKSILDEEYAGIPKKYFTIKSQGDMIKMINANTPQAFITLQSRAQHYVDLKRFARNGEPVYHLMRSPLIPDHGVHIVSWGSPFWSILNTYFTLVNEAGLNLMWHKGHYIVPEMPQNPTDRTKFTMDNVQAIFLFWSIGLSLATLVFCTEILYHHMKKH